MNRESKNKIPNLDALVESDLKDFYEKYSHPSLDEAADLVGDRRRGYTMIAKSLATYAINKLSAMRCREKGLIGRAEHYEDTCKRLYQSFPKDLRW